MTHAAADLAGTRGEVLGERDDTTDAAVPTLRVDAELCELLLHLNDGERSVSLGQGGISVDLPFDGVDEGRYKFVPSVAKFPTNSSERSVGIDALGAASEYSGVRCFDLFPTLFLGSDHVLMELSDSLSEIGL